MDFTALIHQYGYYAVLIGTLLEGETILVLAGIAAHQGYLNPLLVWLTAIAGAILGDQLFYFLGHRYGAQLLQRFPAWATRALKVRQLIARYHAPVIVILRFTYGVRTIGPMLVGMSAVTPLQFSVWNTLGAVLWATLIVVASYLFGDALHWLLRNIQHIEVWILLGIAAIGALTWLVVRWRARR
jgi:membrane protein DedA with SNARE-associated domain